MTKSRLRLPSILSTKFGVTVLIYRFLELTLYKKKNIIFDRTLTVFLPSLNVASINWLKSKWNLKTLLNQCASLALEQQAFVHCDTLRPLQKLNLKMKMSKKKCSPSALLFVLSRQIRLAELGCTMSRWALLSDQFTRACIEIWGKTD